MKLQSQALHARGLTGRILWSGGTPAPRGGEPAAAAVAATGSGEGQAAYVLIHGIGVSHRYLARLHVVLSASAPTYSLDLPGFAGTPKPERQLSVVDYGAFIAEALAACGITSYILVGHSMGAQFAIEAALAAPERAEQLVLMGPVVDSRYRNVRRQSLALFLDALLAETPSSNWAVFTDYLRCGPRWYFTELPVMMAYRTEERLRAVAAPVLVLRGERDHVAGSGWSRHLAEAVPQGRFVEIPGAGHVAQHLRPDAVASAIRHFVTATARRT
ncbi:alpha/beta fold hydrolase [Pseudarthrobacter sp. NPDC092439]|uniref:alpha/beta fold hydrolase n=1 Tax=unclassified Pseudarthrobacter TaxID=2647000 RepID=UPI0037FB4B27